jgi:hypothetical protein
MFEDSHTWKFKKIKVMSGYKENIYSAFIIVGTHRRPHVNSDRMVFSRGKHPWGRLQKACSSP